MSAAGFDQFFTKLSDGKDRLHWQRELSEPSACGNRLIRVPTGFGKTLGVLAAWVWHRVLQRNDDWPRRLVWCLPMRVLVEQTEDEVRSALQRLEMLWDGKGPHNAKVGVHFLMGGADAGQWHLYPEGDAVLIGTQDMLLSRAMNRGYASPRARWPMEFGLLNQDALWVMDEVQLMDVGLATSGQLQAFRRQDAEKSPRPCFTWWMSATLQHEWLQKSPDTAGWTQALEQSTHRIERQERTGHLWDDVTKTLDFHSFRNSRELAGNISDRHRKRGCGKEGPTLVVVNTVKRAVKLWKALKRNRTLKRTATEICLMHSQFRPSERRTWRETFLNRGACARGTNRIIVSTQVIEAGVDFSAALLATELAPWPSLVQRFGRCARWGGEGEVLVADFEHKNDGRAAPYSVDELAAARDACHKLREVGPADLERFEEENETLLPSLYPYEPKHLLLRHELDELFDTSPDLSGADIDISRFIRSGQERDVQVFWASIDGSPPSTMKPDRSELCSVPFLKARNWLCHSKSENLRSGVRAWIWDWLNHEWREVKRRDIYPGRTLLVEARTGGYRYDQGWDPISRDPVEPVATDNGTTYLIRSCWKRDEAGWRPSERRVRALHPEDHTDDAEDDESLSSSGGWQTIAVHGLQVGKESELITAQLVPALANLLYLAGLWHDLGKAHPAFQGSIRADDRPKRDDIAKAPDIAWPCSLSNMFRMDSTDQRRGFRHELASAMALFGVLQRHKPEHPALLGPWIEWFEAIGEVRPADPSGDPVSSTVNEEPTAIEREVLDLPAHEFDLLAYLVCSHHGKVRMAWHASPADQKVADHRLRIRGIQEGDILPPLLLAVSDDRFQGLPATVLDLSPSEMGLSTRTGRSWTERVLNLMERFGPFTLAWLEAILRAADQRASKQPISDQLLQEQENTDGRHRLQ